jgi:hypothetical protein
MNTHIFAETGCTAVSAISEKKSSSLVKRQQRLSKKGYPGTTSARWHLPQENATFTTVRQCTYIEEPL